MLQHKAAKRCLKGKYAPVTVFFFNMGGLISVDLMIYKPVRTGLLFPMWAFYIRLFVHSSRCFWSVASKAPLQLHKFLLYCVVAVRPRHRIARLPSKAHTVLFVGVCVEGNDLCGFEIPRVERMTWRRMLSGTVDPLCSSFIISCLLVNTIFFFLCFCSFLRQKYCQ